MATERLYYTDSFLREFDATALTCDPFEDGHWQARLDRTVFYPTSGGQPHDTGRLGHAVVVDVIDREEDDEIFHLTDRPVPLGFVHGSIDWDRRFDHIQQHTGQHLLSAAFLKLFDFPTVSFHLGRETSTIDLDAPNIVPRHLEEAAGLVNQVVFDDRPITVTFREREALAALGVRKEVQRKGMLRVIEIEGFDLQPCGGTHAARTGQTGPLLIRKLERQKKSWRLEFACGGRALRAANSDFEALGAAARQIGCGMADVPASVARMLEERKAAHRALAQLSSRLAEFEAAALLASAQDPIVHAFDEGDPAFLRQVASLLAARPGMRAILACRASRHLVFAQSKNSAGDMSRLLRETVSAAGGKGGGSKDLAQGTLPESANIDEVLTRARELLIREPS